ncbi:Quinone oxidoreductase 1 [Aquisphaera giovannonii]|uniref:Quinone oxidoreductase 1 n=1 Tax=Aquisphaera giovannonii TaxID=406548 RepID=A0A5B9W9X1_9BACT|nr:NADPH:quinone reductase [Aquisphaera giovannonii]QEH36881.1 Quinone oxidoreductase 1 [Aquisphaera giovannonii]
MKAAYIEQTGPPENILVGDLPEPEPGPGEVLIRVKAVALNPIDLYIRSGLVAFPLSYPYVIGCDVAGTVESLGAGCRKFKEGDRAWASNQGLLGRQGVAAEYACVAEEWLHHTPALLPDDQAAAMAMVGITAHLGLFQCGQLRKGETVYVPGGSGGIGSMVVQMVKAAGGRVATSAGSSDHVEICNNLGADLALNYRTDDIPARLREFAPDGFDVWYETQREPNLEFSIPLLRKRGRMILMAGRTARPVLPLGSLYPRNCSIHGFAIFNFTAQEQEPAAMDLVRWIEEGQIRPMVGRTFPLAAAVEAERYLEENSLHGAGKLAGKVVISVD